MGRFLVKRIISMIITLFLITTITFSLMHAIPGGPFTKERRLPETIERALIKKYKLDDPVWKQYLDYMGGVLKGDLGPSFKYEGQTTNSLIRDGFPTSAKLGTLAVLLVVILGIPFGIISALNKNKWQDYTVMIMATLGVTIPNFVIATVLIYIFANKLGWLPTFGTEAGWKSFILPVIALSGYAVSFVSRLTRSSMLEILQQDYIKTARAKGLPETVVIYKHALKNALIPVVTYLGPLFAAIITGSFVVEKIFALPGTGRHFVQSITNRDYTVIMGMTIFFSILLVSIMLVVDLSYGLIDPRIKVDE